MKNDISSAVLSHGTIFESLDEILWCFYFSSAHRRCELKGLPSLMLNKCFIPKQRFYWSSLWFRNTISLQPFSLWLKLRPFGAGLFNFFFPISNFF